MVLKTTVSCLIVFSTLSEKIYAKSSDEYIADSTTKTTEDTTPPAFDPFGLMMNQLGGISPVINSKPPRKPRKPKEQSNESSHNDDFDNDESSEKKEREKFQRQMLAIQKIIKDKQNSSTLSSPTDSEQIHSYRLAKKNEKQIVQFFIISILKNYLQIINSNSTLAGKINLTLSEVESLDRETQISIQNLFKLQFLNFQINPVIISKLVSETDPRDHKDFLAILWAHLAQSNKINFFSSITFSENLLKLFNISYFNGQPKVYILPTIKPGEDNEGNQKIIFFSDKNVIVLNLNLTTQKIEIETIKTSDFYTQTKWSTYNEIIKQDQLKKETTRENQITTIDTPLLETSPPAEKTIPAYDQLIWYIIKLYSKLKNQLSNDTPEIKYHQFTIASNGDINYEPFLTLQQSTQDFKIEEKKLNFLFHQAMKSRLPIGNRLFANLIQLSYYRFGYAHHQHGTNFNEELKKENFSFNQFLSSLIEVLNLSSNQVEIKFMKIFKTSNQSIQENLVYINNTLYIITPEGELIMPPETESYQKLKSLAYRHRVIPKSIDLTTKESSPKKTQEQITDKKINTNQCFKLFK